MAKKNKDTCLSCNEARRRNDVRSCRILIVVAGEIWLSPCECIAIALISHDHEVCRRASCRHDFRHEDSATIERIAQGGVLRGLRVPDLLNPHACDFHSNSRVTAENLHRPRKMSIRSLNSIRYVAGLDASKPRENSAPPRNPHSGNSPRGLAATHANELPD